MSLRRIAGVWLVPVAFVAAVMAIGALNHNGGGQTSSVSVSSEVTPTVVQVPAVEGHPLAYATVILGNFGLSATVTQRYSHELPGTVLGQKPKPGRSVALNATVELRVAKPFLRIPNVVGLTLAEARHVLREHFRPGLILKVYSATLPEHTVISQSPKEGAEARSGRYVSLVVSKGPQPGPYGNPWGYNFDCCHLIYNPPSNFCDYFYCMGYFWSGNGYVMQCADGWFGKSGGIQGSCSSHGGNSRALLAP